VARCCREKEARDVGPPLYVDQRTPRIARLGRPVDVDWFVEKLRRIDAGAVNAAAGNVEDDVVETVMIVVSLLGGPLNGPGHGVAARRVGDRERVGACGPQRRWTNADRRRI